MFSVLCDSNIHILNNDHHTQFIAKNSSSKCNKINLTASTVTKFQTHFNSLNFENFGPSFQKAFVTNKVRIILGLTKN